MIIGVDVGGTFTDVFFLDEVSQKIEIAKVPSTPEDSSRGFLQGLGTHAKDWSRVRTVVHGTTVGTNALLSRRGAKTGILTTRGFFQGFSSRVGDPRKGLVQGSDGGTRNHRRHKCPAEP